MFGSRSPIIRISITLILVIACGCTNHKTINYQAKLSIEQVRRIADHHAVKNGYDPTKYDKPTVRFDSEKNEWYVSYTLKSSGFIFKRRPVGGDFGFIIDDFSGEIVYFFQGA